MDSNSHGHHFPKEISLVKNPLVESWLELQWVARPSATKTPDQKPLLSPPSEDVDPFFSLALGSFYEQIKAKYPVSESLPANDVPISVLPHTVRYRFRRGKDSWPVIQIGPGVASVNFVKQYNWRSFRDEARYLREHLLSAYRDAELTSRICSLRYRNAIEFDFRENDVLHLLTEKLNISLKTSQHIPGFAGKRKWPADISLSLRFELDKPNGSGILRLATGFELADSSNAGSGEGMPIVFFELEVTSQGDQAPQLRNESQYTDWLEASHAVIHEWFFALIDGPLRTTYEEGLP